MVNVHIVIRTRMMDSVFCLVYVLLHIGIYKNIIQIAKRHTSPVLAFNMQARPNILPDLYLHVESKHRTYASLYY